MTNETLNNFYPDRAYKISNIGGAMVVSQGGQIIFTGKDYNDVDVWLAENDPNWNDIKWDEVPELDLNRSLNMRDYDDVPELTGLEWD